MNIMFVIAFSMNFIKMGVMQQKPSFSSLEISNKYFILATKTVVITSKICYASDGILTDIVKYKLVDPQEGNKYNSTFT